MYVVATAGHVDHGKSTLIRALTGIEPDRWAEERRRGLTIDLGFAWTRLDSGREVAFVDVPGHERFLGNMLAGLGPAPVVLFVVAADEGWCAQSSDHRDAIAALGIEHGLIVVSRVDKAPDRVAEVVAQARHELSDTALRDAPAVGVSAVTGSGLEEVRTSLDGVLAALPAPRRDGRVRLWIDRSFTITGAGPVVTGTLSAGTVRVGDHLDLVGGLGHDGGQVSPVTVRGLQSEGVAAEQIGPISRVALNLRGVRAADVIRGAALVTPGAWSFSPVADVRRVSGEPFDEIPEQLTAHLGTATLQARIRVFGPDVARITFDRTVPISAEDRVVLRSPGDRILAGAVVVDPDPPVLRRRGDAVRRGEELMQLTPATRLAAEVARRGAVPLVHLRRLGLTGDVPATVRLEAGWLVDPGALEGWVARLRGAVAERHRDQPLARGVSRSGAVDLLGLPAEAVLDLVITHADLESSEGYLRDPGHRGLGAAEAAVDELERRLGEQPFAAPEAADLAAAGLGTRELAAAERAGRLLRLGEGVVLLPNAPARAMRTLAVLPQPFTTSDARQALGTTRRVVIPLLEHLDGRGWTRRLDGNLRQVVR